MTKQCKELLASIRAFTDGTTLEIGFEHKRCYVHKIGVLNSKLELPQFSGELDSLFDALVESGHLVQTKFGYKLTHKGLHPMEVSLETLKLFLLKSIVVPIIVAAITALITLWLQGLL